MVSLGKMSVTVSLDRDLYEHLMTLLPEDSPDERTGHLLEELTACATDMDAADELCFVDTVRATLHTRSIGPLDVTLLIWRGNLSSETEIVTGSRVRFGSPTTTFVVTSVVRSPQETMVTAVATDAD